MTMEGGRLECVLDSIQLFRAQVQDICHQQCLLGLESIGRMVALIDLPVSISSVKRRKGSTQYFQTNEVEQCRDENGKENIFAASAVVRSAQLKSCKASGRKTRRGKPLADSLAVNQAHQSDTSMRGSAANEGELVGELGSGQEGNKELVPSMEEIKGASMSIKGNEELVHSLVGNKRMSMSFTGDGKLLQSVKGNNHASILVTRNKELVYSTQGSRSKSMSISPIGTSAGEAATSGSNLGKPSDVPPSNAVSIGGAEPSQVKTGVPVLDAPVMTRARARALQNAGGNVTITRGEPPLKKRRARRPNLNSKSPVKRDETADQVQIIVVQTSLEQQKVERSPSVRSIQSNARDNSHSPPLTEGNTGGKEAFGTEQDMNVSSVCSSPARKGEIAGKPQSIIVQIPLEQREGERTTSRISVAVKRNTRGSSRSLSQTDESVEEKDALAEERDVNPLSISSSPEKKDETAGKMQTIVGQTPFEQQKDERSLSMRSVQDAEGNSNSLPLKDGNVSDKEAFGKAQHMNPSSVCSPPPRKEEIAGETRTLITQFPPEQREGETHKSRRSVAVKRNTRGSLRSPPQTDGTVAEKDAVVEEQDVKAIAIGRSPEDDDETAGKMLFASLVDTRGNSHSPAQMDGNVGEKYAFGDEHDINPNSPSSSPAQEEETAGRIHLVFAQTPLEQPKLGRTPSRMSVRRNVTGSSHSPHGTVGEKAFGEKRELNSSAVCSTPAGKEETAGKMHPVVAQTALEQQQRERPSSRRSVAVKRSTRGNSQSPSQVDGNVAKTDAFGEEQEVKVAKSENVSPNTSFSAAEEGEIFGRPSKKSRTSFGRSTTLNSSSQAETDANITSSKESVLAAYSLLTHSAVVESTETDVGMLSAQNGNASELRLRHSSAKTTEVDVADPEIVEAVIGKIVDVQEGTDLPSGCPAKAADPRRKLSTVKSVLKDSSDTGSKLISVLSSPLLQDKRGEREVDIIASDQTELKTEDTSFISYIHAEEKVEQEERSLREEGHLVEFSNSLAEKEENLGRTPRIVIQSLSVHSSAVELEIKNTEKDAIRTGRASSRLALMSKASPSIEERKDGMHMLSFGDSLEVNASPLPRDCVNVDQAELHNTPLAEVGLLQSADVSEGKFLPVQVTDRTPARKAKLLLSTITDRTPARTANLFQSIATPEVPREELIDEETAAAGPGSRQLKMNEINRLLKTSARGYIQRGLNPRTISDVEGQADERVGTLNRLIQPDLDVDPSVEQLRRKETAGSRECGANEAGSSLTIPVANWRSESFCSMMGVTAKCLPRVMGRALPLWDKIEVQEVPEFQSPKDQKPDREETAIKPSSLLTQDEDEDQDPGTQEGVSALGNSGMLDCSQEIDDDCQASLEGDCAVSAPVLSQEEVNTSKPTSSSRGEEDSAISSFPCRTENGAVPDPSCFPVQSVDSLQQIVSSNMGNPPKPSSNLISSLKSFVPVSQQPPPSFLPDGKRFVKVKALIAAEAVRRAEENGDAKDRLRKKKRGTEARETSVPPKESGEGCKLEGESSCVSILSPRKKVLVRDRSNSRNIFSPKAKSKQAANLEIERKVKQNQADLKRMEEERKRRLLAIRETKEQAVKQNRQKQELLKQKRDQKRMGAELEDLGQRQESVGQGLLQAQKKKGEPVEEKANDPVEGLPLVVRPIVEGQKVRAGQARAGQTPGKIRSKQLKPGALSLRSAVRVPIISKDDRTLQQKGRHPSSSSSSSRLRSSNAEAARLSSLNAESAHGFPGNSIHTFSLDNRPINVRQGGSVESVSYVATPCCKKGVEQEEDMGPTSYEITPYRDSSDDEEDDPRNHTEKQIPFWAWKENLNPHLLKQVTIDPDEIFSKKTFCNNAKTCSLKEVFGRTGSKKIKDFGKRSDSGDWLRDRVSWKEELQYKIAMRYETNSMQQKEP